MRKPQYRQRLAWLCGLALVATACNNPNPASPSLAGGSGAAAAGRIPLCHRTGSSSYVLIEVSASAENAHLAHGDGRPGTAPFDVNCTLLPAPPPAPVPPPDPVPPPPPQPLTLSCGAPTGATHAGSTTYPGPTTSAIGGVQLEFAVTASPAPAGDVWMVREIRDNLATGIQVRQSNVLLSGGSYQGSMFTSGSLSFVREMRFTLDNASCSLFWNINPL